MKYIKTDILKLCVETYIYVKCKYGEKTQSYLPYYFPYHINLIN